jgi:hypothetical protein
MSGIQASECLSIALAPPLVYDTIDPFGSGLITTLLEVSEYGLDRHGHF